MDNIVVSPNSIRKETKGGQEYALILDKVNYRGPNPGKQKSFYVLWSEFAEHIRSEYGLPLLTVLINSDYRHNFEGTITLQLTIPGLSFLTTSILSNSFSTYKIVSSRLHVSTSNQKNPLEKALEFANTPAPDENLQPNSEPKTKKEVIDPLKDEEFLKKRERQKMADRLFLPDDSFGFLNTPKAYQYPHNITQLGYAAITGNCNITSVSSSSTSYIKEVPSIRTEGGFKNHAGTTYRTYTISIIAPSKYEVANSLQPVLEQINLTPILLAEGGLFPMVNKDEDSSSHPIPYNEVIVKGYSLSTVPGSPEALQLDIQVDPFLWSSYATLAGAESLLESDEEKAKKNPEIRCLSDAYCWPIYQFWAATTKKSSYSYSPEIILTIPDPEQVSKIGSEINNTQSTTTGSDAQTIQSLQNLVTRKGEVTSDNIKKLPAYEKGSDTAGFDTEGEYYVIKLNSKANWDKIVKGSLAGMVMGWTYWKEGFDYALADHLGNRVGVGVDIANILVPNEYYQKISSLDTLVDISKSDTQNKQDAAAYRNAIAKYFEDKEYARLQRTVNFQNPEEEVRAQAIRNMKTTIEAAIVNPQDFFGAVIRIIPAEIDPGITKLHYDVAVDENAYFDSRAASFSTAVEGVFASSENDVKLYLSSDRDESVIVTKISVQGGYNLSVTTHEALQLPKHQILGTKSKVITLEGRCTDTDAMLKVQGFYDLFAERAISRKSKDSSVTDLPDDRHEFDKSKPGSAYIHAKGTIFSLMGINFVMPAGIEVSNAPGAPGSWDFVMTFLDFDPRVKEAERLKTLNTYNNQTNTTLKYNDASRGMGDAFPTYLKAIDYMSLQNSLLHEEVYPDLYLPTKTQLNQWVLAFNRLANLDDISESAEEDRALSSLDREIIKHCSGYFEVEATREHIADWPLDGTMTQGRYVDPDFYVYYEKNYFKSTLDEVATDQYGARDVFSPKEVKNEDGSVTAGTLSTLRLSEKLPVSGDNKVVSLVPLDQRGASITNIGDYLPNIYGDNLYMASTGEKATAVTEAIAQGAVEIDQKGTELGWWATAGEMVDLKDFNRLGTDVRPINDVLKKSNILKGEIPKEYEKMMIPFEDAGDLEAIGKGTEEERIFFSYAFRLRAIKTAVTKGITDRLSSEHKWYDLTDPTYNFLLQWKEAGLTDNLEERSLGRRDEVGGDRESGAFRKPMEFLGADSKYQVHSPYEHLEKISKFKTSALVKRPHSPPAEAGTFLTIPRVAQALVKQYPFTVYDKNLLYRKVLESKELKSKSDIWKGGLNQLRTQGEEPLYEVIANAQNVNIPPSIGFAFFNSRSRLGSHGPALDLTGWGDLDLERVVKEVKPDKLSIKGPTYAYRVFGHTYNASTHNRTAVKLLETHFRITRANADYIANKDQIDKLLSLADEAKSFDDFTKYLREAASAGNSLHAMDTYYVHWLGWVRSVGIEADFYETSKLDPFFSGYNPYIAIDCGNMANHTAHFLNPTKYGSRTVMTDYLPSGKPRDISLDRRFTSLDMLSIFSDLQDKDLSLEEQAVLIGKQRLALFPESEDAIYGLTVDLRNHSPFGRLKGAWPAYFLAIINEGFYWKGGAEKLWDQYFTRTAVSSIELVSSVETPASVLTIGLSNVFRSLTNYRAEQIFLEEMAVDQRNEFLAVLTNPTKWGFGDGLLGDVWARHIMKNFDDEMKLIWARNYLNTFVLKPGARIHLRMGYGSNAAIMPVVFNGAITELPASEDLVTIVALSDGDELNKQITVGNTQTNNGWVWRNTGMVGISKSPANIVLESIIQVDGAKSLFLEKLNPFGKFRDMSHGIAHFGDVYIEGVRHYAAEAAVNIYDASPSLDQTPDNNFFNNYAFYDWDAKKTYFSVSVNEATPHKVIDVCRRAVFDFVGCPTMFGVESRVFYGKWWWPCHYAYTAKTLENFSPTIEELQAIDNQSLAVKSLLVNESNDNLEVSEETSELLTTSAAALDKDFASNVNTEDRATVAKSLELLRNNKDRLKIVVKDGDTISFDIDGMKGGRLRYIDAPEKRQRFGTESTKTLKKLIEGKNVIVDIVGFEAGYGRFLVQIKAFDTDSNAYVDVNEEMIRLGMAWAYVDSSTDFKPRPGANTDKTPAELIATQNIAKANRVGLWSDENLGVSPVDPDLARQDGKYIRQNASAISKALEKQSEKDKEVMWPLKLGEVFWDLSIPGGLHNLAKWAEMIWNPKGVAEKKYEGSFLNQMNQAGQKHLFENFILPTWSAQDKAEYRAKKLGYEYDGKPLPGERFKDVEYLTSTLAWKPFTQFYIAKTGINLIQNSIKPDASKVFTDAVGIQTYSQWFGGDSVERTLSVCVDDDIIPSSRRTLTVDSGIYLTAVGGGVGNIQQRITNLFSWVPGFASTIAHTPTTPAVHNSLVTTLADSVANMYSGWITLTGQPTIKPRDIIVLQDDRSGLYGPVRVKTVIHRFDLENGLVTFVSPMALAMPSGSTQSLRIINSTMAMIHKLGAYYLLRRVVMPTVMFMLFKRGMKASALRDAARVLLSDRQKKSLLNLIEDTSKGLDFNATELKTLKEDILVDVKWQLPTKKDADTKAIKSLADLCDAEQEALDYLDDIDKIAKEVTTNLISTTTTKTKDISKNFEKALKKLEPAYVIDPSIGIAEPIPTTPAEKAAAEKAAREFAAKEAKKATIRQRILEKQAEAAKKAVKPGDKLSAYQKFFKSFIENNPHVEEEFKKLKTPDEQLEFMENILTQLQTVAKDKLNAIQSRYSLLEGTSVEADVIELRKLLEIKRAGNSTPDDTIQIGSLRGSLSNEDSKALLQKLAETDGTKLKVYNDGMKKAIKDSITLHLEELIDFADGGVGNTARTKLAETLEKVNSATSKEDLLKLEKEITDLLLSHYNGKALSIARTIKIGPVTINKKAGKKVGSVSIIKDIQKNVTIQLARIWENAFENTMADPELTDWVTAVLRSDKERCIFETPELEAIAKARGIDIDPTKNAAARAKLIDELNNITIDEVEDLLRMATLNMNEFTEAGNLSKYNFKWSGWKLYGKYMADNLRNSGIWGVIKNYRDAKKIRSSTGGFKTLATARAGAGAVWGWSKQLRKAVFSPVSWLSEKFKGAGDIAEAAKEAGEAGAGAIESAKNAVKQLDFLGSLGHDAKKASTALRIGSLVGPQFLLAAAKEIIWMCIGESVVNTIEYRLKARQVVTIYPLFSGGVPYTAGILGHAGAVVGDEPGWIDQWISKDKWGQNLSIACAFFGIDIPDTKPTVEEKNLRKDAENVTNTELPVQ